MAQPPFTLSKSLFTSGAQCHKLLWWRVHEPNAVELQPDSIKGGTLADLLDYCERDTWATVQLLAKFAAAGSDCWTAERHGDHLVSKQVITEPP